MVDYKTKISDFSQYLHYLDAVQNYLGPVEVYEVKYQIEYDPDWSGYVWTKLLDGKHTDVSIKRAWKSWDPTTAVGFYKDIFEYNGQRIRFNLEESNSLDRFGAKIITINNVRTMVGKIKILQGLQDPYNGNEEIAEMEIGFGVIKTLTVTESGRK